VLVGMLMVSRLWRGIRIRSAGSVIRRVFDPAWRGL
jgi:hypothetical protein